jgi:hypothetical protein
MALQNFVDRSQPVVGAAWLNAVDVLKDTIFNSAGTKQLARAALTEDEPLEIPYGGTGARTAGLARAALTTDAPLEIINGGTGSREGATPYWPITTAETTVGVVPTNYAYMEGDIRRYGAVGDNSTNCTDPITNAVRVMSINGGDVRISSGRFKITAAIPLLAKVNIKGEGYGSVIEATTCDAFTFAFTTGFGKVVLEDFYIHGTNCETNVAIYQAGTLNDGDELYGLTISRVLIRYYRTAVSLKNCRVVTIENCWFENINIALNLTGKNLVYNIVGNEFVYGNGTGTSDKTGIILNNFNFSAGTGFVGPEGCQIQRNQIYGFDIGIDAEYANYTTIFANDFQVKLYGVALTTCQDGMLIAGNIIILEGAFAQAAVKGFGLGSTIDSKIVIRDNTVDAVSTTSASGVIMNEGGTQNQNHVDIINNYFKNLDFYDIILFNAGDCSIIGNRCWSADPTYSIRVDNVIAGPVYIDKNLCRKEIYFDPAEAAAGEVVVGWNKKNATTTFFGAQHTPTVASAASLTLPIGARTFIISGGTSITSIVATGFEGERVTLIFEGPLTLTDGGNLRLQGNYNTTADDTITLVCAGGNWFDCGRGVN